MGQNVSGAIHVTSWIFDYFGRFHINMISILHVNRGRPPRFDNKVSEVDVPDLSAGANGNSSISSRYRSCIY